MHAFRLGRLFGIEIRIQLWSLAVLAVWLYLDREHLVFLGLGAPWLEGALFFVLLYALVVCHELGHALAARAFGIRTRYIVLTPLGGIAFLDGAERVEDRPMAEFWYALAGPGVNVALFLVALPAALIDLPEPAARLLRVFLLINLLMGGFNLLPAFPMDGGRVLRALLARRRPFVRATELAAGVGKALALFGGALCVFGSLAGHDLWLPALIAVFVYFAGQRELLVTRWRYGYLRGRGLPKVPEHLRPAGGRREEAVGPAHAPAEPPAVPDDGAVLVRDLRGRLRRLRPLAAGAVHRKGRQQVENEPEA